MDPQRFEDLTRRVSAASSRRSAARVLAGAVAAPLLMRLGQEEAGAIPIVNCKAPGKKCDSNQRCCSQRCKKGRCSCSKKGRPCWKPLEGALCCSQRCHGGKCS